MRSGAEQKHHQLLKEIVLRERGIQESAKCKGIGKRPGGRMSGPGITDFLQFPEVSSCLKTIVEQPWYEKSGPVRKSPEPVWKERLAGIDFLSVEIVAEGMAFPTILNLGTVVREGLQEFKTGYMRYHAGSQPCDDGRFQVAMVKQDEMGQKSEIEFAYFTVLSVNHRPI
jgi:hypothetical protein